MTLKEQIEMIIRSTYEANDRNVSETARQLGLCRSSVQRHLRRMGVRPRAGISPAPTHR